MLYLVGNKNQSLSLYQPVNRSAHRLPTLATLSLSILYAVKIGQEFVRKTLCYLAQMKGAKFLIK